MGVSAVFVDTNTFVYAHTEQDVKKKETCQDWLVALTDRELQRSSLQVANEFSNVLLRKMKSVPSVVVYRLTDDIIEMGGFNVGISTIRLCRDVKHETSYSYWDCLLLASAIELGCSHFLSEDMQAGRTVMGVTIINPMLPLRKKSWASTDPGSRIQELFSWALNVALLACPTLANPPFLMR